MLSAHYRSPINFSEDLLEQAQNGLERIYNCLDNLEYLTKNAAAMEMTESERELRDRLIGLKEKFIDAMDDDLNTADALAAVFDIVKESNTNINAGNNPSKEIIEYAYSLIKELGGVLGIAQKKQDKSIDSEIQELINQSQQARKEKDWNTDDEIRDRLKDMGIILEDTPQGVKWSFRKN